MENLLFNTPLSKENNLLRRFEEIHDFIYANDGLSAQQALEEFVKILFVKIFDENSKENLFSPVNFSDLFEKTKEIYPDIFDKDDKIKLSDVAIKFVINKLQNISLLNSSQDAKGLAFQKFLSSHEKDRQGQFFTPEPVIDFCVAMMKPKPNEKIIDPACGSGGFLMSALKYIQENNRNIDIQNVISENIFGFDINKSILRIAKMKLLLEANIKTNVLCANSLENDGMNDNFDLILANPPFGAKITNIEMLRKFDLGYKWVKYKHDFYKTKNIQSSQNTDILFIERCLKLLKEGGKMGIVLPNGNFENPSLEYLRAYIKQKAKLLAVIKLPQETFIPFGTGVKTSILFLEKDSQNDKKQYDIFWGKVTKLGYQGNKNGTLLYKKNEFGQVIKDKNGQPILEEDFSEIVEQYNNFKNNIIKITNNSFSIKDNELNGRFDFDFYSPENKVFDRTLRNGKTVKLNEICSIVKIKSPKLKNQNETVEYVELSDINTHSFEIINSTTYQVYELPSRASYEIKEGDIITAIAGNSVGTKKHATAFVSKEFDGCICTNGFRVLRNFKIDTYYFLYYLRTEEFLKQMFMYRTGAAIPNVSDADLANIEIYVPFDNEKEKISNQIRKAFELKQAFKNQLDSIKLNIE
ncbi:MAG: N-6 DNA methylase [Bacteroidales bacterium]|jgi:type I restriction enzyme M protein|nr:N-6 DNA methylase [Bacteroidales bacterium]